MSSPLPGGVAAAAGWPRYGSGYGRAQLILPGMAAGNCLLYYSSTVTVYHYSTGAVDTN